ncbi:hypothetical protein [Larsenimonas salina]|uniref:hypothetical protein n=1 Tax=Larsenimonas salina TaxID=1295565 RepID=UPI00207468DC|nr:hypothetical protein [Larsenimonas salina]MCM5705433.1 hypothetical protein [Larsenimonas salina]
MGELYISRVEQEALKKIDSDELNSIVMECIRNSQTGGIYQLGLEGCGIYISNKLRDFQKAIDSHSRAKSSKKREETEYQMRRAADDLTHAVQDMQERMKTEEREKQLFLIDDYITPLFNFSGSLEVKLRYQWRKNTEEDWTYGMITFQYTPDLTPDYSMPLPKRKPSAAKLAQERQEKLRREWEHLKLLSLHSLRDFFRDGGNGCDIPLSFKVTTDSYSRGLNNFSANFWRQNSSQNQKN